MLTQASPIVISGANKFDLEQEAVLKEGVEFCEPFAVPPPEKEKVYLESYDVRYKY